MLTTEEFEQEISKALGQLYSPDYQPSDQLRVFLGCDGPGGRLAVQNILLNSIHALQPQSNVEGQVYPKRMFDVLYARYIQKLTQDESAEQLHISLSSLQRVQREAIHTLARIVWDQYVSREQGNRSEQKEPTIDAQADSWQEQIKRELSSLQGQSSNSVANVGEVIEGILLQQSALIHAKNTRIEIGYMQPDLVGAVHPIVLRQMLITTIRRLAEHTIIGPVTLYARFVDGNVRIRLDANVASDPSMLRDHLLRDLLVPDETQVSATVEGQKANILITLPAQGQVSVLVVDDNVDMYHFYRRCSTGTRYRLTYAANGKEALEKIQQSLPDVIILDVMLPDIDGWDILMKIYQNPETKHIPVIISSVVPEKELAFSLGAAGYLSKPVSPSDFKAVLEKVYPQFS